MIFPKHLIESHRPVVPQLVAFFFQFAIGGRPVYARQGFGNGNAGFRRVHPRHLTHLARQEKVKILVRNPTVHKRTSLASINSMAASAASVCNSI